MREVGGKVNETNLLVEEPVTQSEEREAAALDDGQSDGNELVVVRCWSSQMVVVDGKGDGISYRLDCSHLERWEGVYAKLAV